MDIKIDVVVYYCCSVKETEEMRELVRLVFGASRRGGLRDFPYRIFFSFVSSKSGYIFLKIRKITTFSHSENTFLKNLSSESGHSQNSTFDTFCLTFLEHRRKA
jgi:hypothetical protein